MSIPASTSDLSASPPDSPPAPRSRGRLASSPWVWMTLACVLLGASGGVRAWQDYRFATVESEGKNCPFPLKDLPKTLGNDWHLEDGGESNLDPKVAQVAGCTDSLIRTYRNATTGVSVTALILFGPGKTLAGHTPEICYPSAGYRMVADPSVRAVASSPGPATEFRSEVFARDQGQRIWREEVYYSFRHGDRWSPDGQRFWKEFRHRPAMLKVQVQRTVSDHERRDVNNPTEDFLALLMPEIERRVALAQVGREQ
jgi:hypothetical protein